MPTVRLKELFFELIIDTNERRDVDTFDILVIYLHLEIPKDKSIVMNLRGRFVGIVCQVNPEYKEH